MVWPENFLKFFSLTYNVVLLGEHDRECVAACEGIPQYLQLGGDYIYHLAHYMFAAGWWSDIVDQFTNLGSVLSPLCVWN